MKIKSVRAREIFDSRGFPTVEARVELECGVSCAASVPSGASTGSHEARELRDGGERLMGKGVTRAAANVNTEISRAVIGMDADMQRDIDAALEALDGTDNLERLGANACLAVSLACARAAAEGYGMPLHRYLGGVSGGKLPTPMMNVLNGGAHAANNIDIQEFMLVPVGAESFSRAMRMCAEVYHALRILLIENGLSAAVGDEGGFAPSLDGDERALDYLCEAVRRAGMTPGVEIAFALDAAVSDWFEAGKYISPKRGDVFTREELIGRFIDLAVRYPIISVEDPLFEDDFEGFAEITKKMRGKLIVGDDLFVTDARRVTKGIAAGAANAVLIKPNQAGTLSRALDAINAARAGGMDVIISHRSGETGSSFIADLAVAANARFIKAGAPARSERVEKYNRLLEIEENRT